jgi:hypothetical protein
MLSPQASDSPSHLGHSPNGNCIVSTHQAQLPFPHLPLGAVNAHIFPDLQGQALLSTSTFCDAGCTALFLATEVHINFKGKTVVTGARVPPGLWTTSFNVNHLLTPQANSTYTVQVKSNAIKSLHTSCFSPATATWTKAIDQGFFRSIPVLTASNREHAHHRTAPHREFRRIRERPPTPGL